MYYHIQNVKMILYAHLNLEEDKYIKIRERKVYEKING